MTLTIAIPSKGRLKEQCQDVLAAAGFTVKGGADSRNYQGRIEGRDDVEVAFLSASEIAREVAKGSVHLGITGEDLVQENIANYNELIAKIQPLGFGHADVIVALPQSWIDVDTMADLDDVAADYRQRYDRRLRVATKYWSLTQRFFEKKGIVTYRIVESLGATEGAPAAGLADVIVDITSTGSTLRANHLKILSDGFILRSQATLFASRKAPLSAAGKLAAEALAAGLAASIDPVTLKAEFFDESLMKQEKVSEIF